MKKSRFTDEQIANVLAEARAGSSMSEVCRKHGISHYTFYQWRKKFGGMQANEVRRTKALEEENAKLRRIVAGQAVELLAAKDIISRFR